jgi:P27 family predicted phage terminase small subunit
MGKRGPITNVNSDRTKKGRNARTLLDRPSIDLGKAVKPKDLTGPASEAWDTLAPLLESVGALTLADTISFYLLCSLYGKCRQLDQTIQVEGVMIKRKRAGAIPHPGLAQLNALSKSFATLAEKFGLTPISRERLWPLLQFQKTKKDREDEESDNPFVRLARESSKAIN